MGQTEVDWTGDDWEEHCLNLLRLRYPVAGELECIPADDQGDLGIEAFAHDGSVYQCYAPDGPLTIKDRYARQRDKLTEDIGKLEQNAADLRQVLGEVVIKTYVFMTPIHDSRRLNSHAKKKAQEMRAKGLAHLAPDFNVVIHTEEHYVLERQQLLNVGLQKLHLASGDVHPLEVQAYVDSNPDLIQTIDSKLGALGLDTAGREGLRGQLLTRKLGADNKMDEIRGHHPAAWERIIELRVACETTLEIKSAVSTTAPDVHLLDTAEGYQRTLQSNIAFLSDLDAAQLAWGTTTDWLAECPLSFKAMSA